MFFYDVAVVGAGPAGMMAAICAGQQKKSVGLFEKGNAPGRKILLSGKGRCNVTNIVSLHVFLTKFGKQGEFLRTAFKKFFNQDLIDFFEAKGLALKIERQGRVFPVTDKAVSILEVLKRYLVESNVKVLYNRRVVTIEKKDRYFKLCVENGEQIEAGKVILACGGESFRFTGSSGDGFAIAKSLGHTIVPLSPGLVPLKTREAWVKELKGLTLKNICFTFKTENKKIVSDIGELLFTHFGISGPLVLDLSSAILALLENDKKALLYIDLKPGLTDIQLDERLLREFRLSGSKNISNVLKDMLPLRLIPVFLNLLNFDTRKKGNQISRQERHLMIHLLKAFPLEIIGALPMEEAMVTCGGISTKEINPQTMESRIVAGLYFAGEIIDASASSGGYNLQQAFSTGYLAGEAAAISV